MTTPTTIDSARSARTLRRLKRGLALQPLARALAACSLLSLALQPTWAQAQTLPTGLSVAAGQAQVAVSGSRMTVTNTPQAILNWSSFNIGAANAVHFQQANAASSVLNRVTGNDSSAILGSLSSNGRVWLLNPNGVIFGQNARVDVAGLVTSTLRLNDSDFLAGRYSFSAGNPSAEVLNQGELRSSFGGTIALLGDGVRNEGSIQADGGQIILAAGKSIELIDTGAPYLGVRITADAGAARNLGTLQAAGGRIDIHAAAVNQSGIVSADGFAAGPGGEVWIKASGPIDTTANSRTSADGTQGGLVHIESDTGRSSLRGDTSAQGSSGVGGDVAVLGREVGLLDNSRIDVSGTLGGGHVVVGGGLQGKDLRYANAQAVYFGPDASITANASEQGKGGHIVLWSDKATRAFGSLSVRGGEQGGDGGFIETSGGWLDSRPAKVDTSAPRGRSGEWLLDPFDILINDFVSTQNVDASYTATGSNASINSSTITNALSNGTNVTISTGGAAGSESGDITVSGAFIGPSLNGNVSAMGDLTLIADRDVNITNSTIASGDAAIAVTLRAGASGSGAVRLTNSTIDTSGNFFGGLRNNEQPLGVGTRDILITGTGTGTTPTGGSFNGASGGVFLTTSTIAAGGGSVFVYGTTPSTTDAGVLVADSSVTGYSIDIKGSSANTGVRVTGFSLVKAEHAISVMGRSTQDSGFALFNSSQLAVDTGGGAGGGLLVQARSTGSAAGLVLASSSSTITPIVANGGSTITLEGATAAGDGVILSSNGLRPSVDGTSAGAVSIRGLDANSQIRFDGGSFIGGSTTTVRGGLVSVLNNASVSSPGPLKIETANLTMASGTSISSSATGDAIVVSNVSNTPITTFDNSSSSGALATPNGRWIIYGSSPTAAGWLPGALNGAHDFRRYGAAYGAWSGDSGKGFVFSGAQSASFTAVVSNRVYDGTTTVPLGNVSVSAGVVGDTGSLKSNVTASYLSKDAGTGKPAAFNSSSYTGGSPFQFLDSSGKPVYGYTMTGALQGTVTPRQLFGTATVVNREYDGGTSAALIVSSPSGLVSGENVTVTGSGVFSDKNVGNNKPVTGDVYAVQNGSGGLGSNYTFTSLAEGLAGNITPRPIALTGLSALNKVYDATTAATLTGSLSAAALPGDSVSVQGTPVASFSDKNVGVAKVVSVTGLFLGGPDAFNYTLGGGVATADITPRPIDLSGLTVANKVYDGNTAASVSGVPSLIVLPGDSVAFSGNAKANFLDKNVGKAKPVTLTDLTLTGLDAQNYAVGQVSGLTADITPLALTVLGLSGVNRAYDGTTAATLSGTAAVASIAGDRVTLGGTPTASFGDKNVGSGKSIAVSGYTLAGADAGNYTVAQPQGLRADITLRALVVNGISALDKVYDGNTRAVLTGTASVSALPGDVVSLGGAAVGSFADKNAGSSKLVTPSGYTLSGADASNYVLAPSQGLTATISPLPVAVTGVSAQSRAYDGTTAASLSATARVDTLAGDAVTLGGTPLARFGDKNVGANKPVAVSGYTLNGADASNYVLTQPLGLSASINPLGLLVTGLSVQNKVYDGTTAASLSGTGRVAALDGDSVSLGGAALAVFADKNAGSNKAVLLSGYTLSGADASNYTVLSAGPTATISPLAVAVTGVAAVDRPYDGTTAAALSGTARAATLAGDAVTVGGTPLARFGDKNVGTGKAVTVSGYALVGADANNYALTQPLGLSASVTPMALSVSGLSVQSKVYDGTTAATLTGTARIGTVPGDAVTVGGAAVGNFVDRNAGNGKQVLISGYTLSGADAANYSLVSSPAGLTGNITPAPLQYVAAAEVRSVGQPLDGLAGTVVGFIAGETLGTATQGTPVFRGLVPAGSPPGVYGVQGSGLTAGNYSFTQAPGNATALTLIDLTPQTAAVLGQILPPPSNIAVLQQGLGGSRDLPPAGFVFDTAAPAGPARPVSNFGAVNLASLSQAEIQSLLAGRRLFMQGVLGESSDKLAKNPALADLKECETSEEARAGTCLITARFKDRMAAGTVVAAAPAVSAPVPATPPAAPAAPPAAAPPSAPAPAPVIVAAAPPPAAIVRAPTFSANKRGVRTAALPQIERKIALVVGVDRYDDAAIPSLSNAVNDARAVAKVFESKLGYETVVLENATKASLVAALNQLALTVGPRDSVVVYYAGHGELVETTKLGYWLLSDSVSKQPETWLSNTDISRLIAQMGASQVALVSDSCYSGSLASEERIRALSGTLDPKVVLDKKSVVVMSSGGNEPVFDDGKDGHSPFAWNLMNNLSGLSNWQAGGNVFERVRFAVARTLPQRPQYSASRAAGHQPGGDYLFEQRQLDATP